MNIMEALSILKDKRLDWMGQFRLLVAIQEMNEKENEKTIEEIILESNKEISELDVAKCSIVAEFLNTKKKNKNEFYLEYPENRVKRQLYLDRYNAENNTQKQLPPVQSILKLWYLLEANEISFVINVRDEGYEILIKKGEQKYYIFEYGNLKDMKDMLNFYNVKNHELIENLTAEEVCAMLNIQAWFLQNLFWDNDTKEREVNIYVNFRWLWKIIYIWILVYS